jgi:hypothetical protein
MTVTRQLAVQLDHIRMGFNGFFNREAGVFREAARRAAMGDAQKLCHRYYRLTDDA